MCSKGLPSPVGKSLPERLCRSVPHGLAGCSRRRALRLVDQLRQDLLGETTKPQLSQRGQIRWTGGSSLSALSRFKDRRLANSLCHWRDGRCCVRSNLAEEVLEKHHP